MDFSSLVSDDFYGDPECTYHFHADLSRQGGGDAAGFAFAYNAGTDSNLLIENQRRPEKAILIEVPFAIAIRALTGSEIEFAHIRRLIYWLRDVRGFRFRKSSYDGWRKALTRCKPSTVRALTFETFSLDRTMTGYATLKDGLCEGRIFHPRLRADQDDQRARPCGYRGQGRPLGHFANGASTG